MQNKISFFNRKSLSEIINILMNDGTVTKFDILLVKDTLIIIKVSNCDEPARYLRYLISNNDTSKLILYSPNWTSDAQRNEFILKLHSKKVTQTNIANFLDISQPLVCAIIVKKRGS